MNTFRIVFFLITISFYGNTFLGQSTILDLPRKSPKAKVMQRIGVTDVTVVYHRPSVNGREIWGDLIPFEDATMPWRAGANENTTIAFSADVQVNGNDLPAGTYGLHMIPTEEEVTVIFNKEHNSWGSFSYNEDMDALRITANYQTVPFREMLTYEFTDVTASSATCKLVWADRAIPFTITADEENVLASVRDQLRTEAGWTWLGWYEAANYCFQNNINHDEGLRWASRSIWTQPNMFNIRVKARLMAQQKGLEGEAFQASVIRQMEEDMNQEPVDWKAWSDGAKFVLHDYGDAETAIQWADRSMEQYETFDNTSIKAEALRAQGHDKKAGKLMDNILASANNYQMNKYGYQLLYSGRGEEALNVFHANAEQHADDPNVWDSLGEAYFTLGDFENARKYLKKCLSMEPSPFLRTHAEKLLQKTEQKISQ